MRILTACVAVCLVSLCGVDAAHAEGGGNFYSRIGLGFNASTSSFDDVEEATLSTTGIGLQGELVAGYKLTDRLIIHATGFFSTAIDPEFNAEVDGEDFDLPSDNETFFLMWVAGAGVTYELPSGFYLTNSIGVSQIGVETQVPDPTDTDDGERGVDTYSDPGFVSLFGFGKEWMVNDTVGIGVAANFYFGFHGIDEEGIADDTATTIGGGLMGTVSFD